MTGQWLRFFAGATLTLSIAGHALAEEGKVTVFAAASLTNAMQDIAKEYKREGRGGGFFICLFIDPGTAD